MERKALPSKRARKARPPHEALVEALFANADAGVLLIDPERTVAQLNAAAAQLLSVPAGRSRGLKASDLVRTVVARDDPVRDAFKSANTERDAVLLARSGAEVPVLLHSYRLGRPAWVLMTLRDLTRMRRMQLELRRHERLATLGQLSAGVAHEIRNPLAGIGTSAQVLLRRFEPRDDRAKFVRVILEEVERLDRIVASLLTYARPRVPELQPAQLAPTIERVLELSADAIRTAGITVQVDVAPRLQPVYIDEDLVTQVLLNVTLNAVQAMPEGGTLRYEVRQLRRKGPPRGPGRRESDTAASRREARRRTTAAAPWLQYQQVRVIDTGPGVSRGNLSKLFDPFFSTKARGTGLGLSISQTIMQEHGGTIVVASHEGHGTTVLLGFPVEKRHGERRNLDSDAQVRRSSRSRADAAHR